MNKQTVLKLLYGIAVGDALGSTAEFVPTAYVPHVYMDYKHTGWPLVQAGNIMRMLVPGMITDDTEMACCVVRGWKDPVAIAREFVKWKDFGPEDIGGTTKYTLDVIKEGGTSYWSGGMEFYCKYPRSAANGSLMRNGVVPGMCDSIDDAYELTLKHGMITHYAPLPQLCCMAQTYVIWSLLSNSFGWDTWLSDFKSSALAHIKNASGDVGLWRDTVTMSNICSAMNRMESFGWNVDSYNPYYENIGIIGPGYCLLTLKVAMWGLYAVMEDIEIGVPDNFPRWVFTDVYGSDRIAWIAMLGHDCDTYGATAGPMIAAAGYDFSDALTSCLVLDI